MPKYRVRLESPGSKSLFRVMSFVADNAEAAEHAALRREYARIGYQLGPAELEALETLEKAAKAAKTPVPADPRHKLLIHRQQLPYKVVNIEDVK